MHLRMSMADSSPFQIGRPKRRPEVIVIGAGAAGLAAAERLRLAGVDYQVLEARPRIGGRIHSFPHYGDWPPIELGAEFVHGRLPETWNRIRRTSLAPYEVDFGCSYQVNRGVAGKSDELWRALTTVLDAMRSRITSSEDISFLDALDVIKGVSDSRKRLVRSFVEGYHAADPALASAQALIRSGESADLIFRLLSGYSGLFRQDLEVLGERLNLRKEVLKVRWERGKVEVETFDHESSSHERFHADQVIVTLPLGVLKRGNLFEPEPEPLALINHLEVSPVIKINFVFDDAFWKKAIGEDLVIMHSIDSEFPTWWTASPFHVPLLVGWSGGPGAWRLSRLNSPIIIDTALESLGEITKMRPSKLRERLQITYLHNWQTDPFALGAYSYVAKGGIPAHERLCKPIQNTLYLAGEALAPLELIGTVEGALISGKEAAQRLVEFRGAELARAG